MLVTEWTVKLFAAAIYVENYALKVDNELIKVCEQQNKDMPNDVVPIDCIGTPSQKPV